MIEVGMEPAPPDWPTAGDEIWAGDFGPFSPEALARDAAVSGDDNPLHLDPESGRAAGLAGPPVHGMLMLSCFESLIMLWRRDLFIARLSGKFLRPVLAGQCIRVSGRVMRRQDVPSTGARPAADRARANERSCDFGGSSGLVQNSRSA